MLACEAIFAAIMAHHHVIISGTGRAGTTFLVQLLTSLGLDTGFASPTSGIYENCNAGMEFETNALRESNAPYIFKSPWLCDCLDAIVGGGEVVIDHAIIPIRELYAAAESRRTISKKAGITEANVTPGGLWHTAVPGDQETVLTHQLYKLLFAVAKHEIPITLLYFPRFVSDPGYLYTKLRFLLMNGMNYEAFLKSFHSISRPELVHEFART
jgi:hypothetical protein